MCMLYVMTKTRVNLEFTEQDMRLLRTAQEQTEAVTRTDALRRALRLLTTLTHPSVSKVTVERQDGAVETVVLV